MRLNFKTIYNLGEGFDPIGKGNGLPYR